MPLSRALDRCVALSNATTLRAACSSVQLALSSTPHASTCSCMFCAGVRDGAQGLHTSASQHRQTKPKVVLRGSPPPQWAYQGSVRESNMEYSRKRREWKEQVAVLRNEWRPLVDRHNKQVSFRFALLQRIAAPASCVFISRSGVACGM